MATNIYSNAFNFSSYLTGKVDLRTGQYGFTQKLATLRPRSAPNQTRDIVLRFSALNTTNIGYGKGWSLNCNSVFDDESPHPTIRLFNGTTYRAEYLPDVGNKIEFKDKKIRDTVMVRSGEQEIRIFYKDGTVEILTKVSDVSPYQTTEWILESGETFHYNYDISTGHLTSITNAEKTVLLELIYQGNGYEISYVDKRTSDGKIARVTFSFTGENLTTISLPYDPNIASDSEFGTQLDYDDIHGFSVIWRVTSPVGSSEIIKYNRDGHLVDSGIYVPNVLEWMVYPGVDQPDVRKTYEYSWESNFLGYPLNEGYKEGIDNLYRLEDYSYWTEERTIDPNSNATLNFIKTTYNKFHLVTNEVQERGNSRISKEIEYNELPNKQFDDQPPNLQLPKQITVRYTLLGKSREEVKYREEVTLMETDKYGNPLTKTEPSGIRYEYTYYPVNGEEGLCPAEPFRYFQNYVKQERIVPKNNDGNKKITDYKYSRLSVVNAPENHLEYFVVQTEEKSNPNASDTSDTITTTSSYYNNISDPKRHGRMEASVVSKGGKNTTTKFSYAFDENKHTITETRRLEGYDGTWNQVIRVTSDITDELFCLKKTDEETLDFEWDMLGRLITETSSKGTTNEAKRRYSYQFKTDSNKFASMTTTDALGKKYLTRYDGLGRQVSMTELLDDNSEREIKTIRYNSLDQMIQETISDQIDQKTLQLTSRYTYNDWGEQSRITHPDGSVTLSEKDLLENTTTEGVEGLDTTIVKYNSFGKEESVTHVGKDNETLKILTSTYDGLSRPKTKTDIDGNRVEYRYDAFDRVVSSSNISADSSTSRVTTTEYASHTSSTLVTSIKVDNKLLGSRRYDGIGRILEEKLGSKEQGTTFSYLENTFVPDSSRTARGIEHKYQYNPHLATITEIKKSDQSSLSTFAYHPVTGNITQTRNDHATHHIEYDDYQRPRKETRQMDGTNYESTYSYSPAGRLLSYTSAVGETEEWQYDAFGRLEKIITKGSNSSSTQCYYDNFGRVHKVAVVNGSLNMDIQIAFDNFGRELSRTIKTNGSLLQTFTCEYYRNGRLSRKKLVDNSNNAILNNEAYEYDSYGRLVSYQCEGSQSPTDRLGRKIKKQTFEFDSLTNITKVISSFVDGVDNVITRTFDNENPTQLVRVTQTNPAGEYSLSYDESGNLTRDQQGQTIEYDELDQLVSLKASNGETLCQYKYDASGSQIGQDAKDQSALHLHYRNKKLIGETQGDIKLHYLSGNDKVVGRYIEQQGQSDQELNVADNSGSVKKVLTGENENPTYSYTPYGESSHVNENASLPLIKRRNIGFNGERLDSIANLYHLGNGTRAYSPELMIFLSPDPLSPFGEGGFNCYAYCHGDPINRQDPSGLISSGWSLGLALLGLVVAFISLAAAIPTGGASLTGFALAGAIFGVVGGVAGIVSGTLGVAAASLAIQDEQTGTNNAKHIEGLNWASIGFGIGSIVAGLGSAGIAGAGRVVSASTKMTGVSTFRSGIRPPVYTLKELRNASNNGLINSFTKVRSPGNFTYGSASWARGVARSIRIKTFAKEFFGVIKQSEVADNLLGSALLKVNIPHKVAVGINSATFILDVGLDATNVGTGIDGMVNPPKDPVSSSSEVNNEIDENNGRIRGCGI